MDKVDQEYLQEIIEGEAQQQKKHDVEFEDDGTTLKTIEELAAANFGIENPSKECEVVWRFINVKIFF